MCNILAYIFIREALVIFEQRDLFNNTEDIFFALGNGSVNYLGV